jgi:hypothetical protein
MHVRGYQQARTELCSDDRCVAKTEQHWLQPRAPATRGRARPRALCHSALPPSMPSASGNAPSPRGIVRLFENVVDADGNNLQCACAGDDHQSVAYRLGTGVVGASLISRLASLPAASGASTPRQLRDSERRSLLLRRRRCCRRHRHKGNGGQSKGKAPWTRHKLVCAHLGQSGGWLRRSVSCSHRGYHRDWHHAGRRAETCRRRASGSRVPYSARLRVRHRGGAGCTSGARTGGRSIV